MDATAKLAAAVERLAGVLAERATEPQPPGGLPPGPAVVWQRHGGAHAVRRPAVVAPDLLVGMERQKGALFDNVGRFIAGRPAQDVLLWGDRGTGKSSLARALLTRFPDGPLALLEIPEPCLAELPAILDRVAEDPRRWVLYLDDLSFRSTGESYRELKVLLEGGLAARPDNTLVVATSNRRHLIPESFPGGDEIHPEERVAEEISLADRFGLSLGFYPFDEPTYLAAVGAHLAALGCAAAPGWQDTARQWAMARGIRSGRAALQAAREIAATLP